MCYQLSQTKKRQSRHIEATFNNRSSAAVAYIEAAQMELSSRERMQRAALNCSDE